MKLLGFFFFSHARDIGQTAVLIFFFLFVVFLFLLSRIVTRMMSRFSLLLVVLGVLFIQTQAHVTLHMVQTAQNTE